MLIDKKLKYSYNDVSITITIDSPILCYYHNYPVAIDKSTRLFRIKDKSIDPHLLTVLINYELINFLRRNNYAKDRK